MKCNKNFINIVLLGISFFLILTPYKTLTKIQKTIFESVREEDENFHGDGYIGSAIMYGTLAIFNWFTPSVISIAGAKYTMFFGSFVYALFILAFLWPRTWFLYTANSLLGIGGALTGPGQGNYLSLNSTPATITRNSSLLWAMFQSSLFFGNIFVFFQFRGLTHIDSGTRKMVVWVLLTVSLLGTLFLLTLRKPEITSQTAIPKIRGPKKALTDALALFITKRILLLCFSFFYTGVHSSFFGMVYSSCIAFTVDFETKAKELVGISGMIIGVGDVLGGLLFGFLAAKIKKLSRSPIYLAGYVIDLIAFILIFLNIPNKAPFKDTKEHAIMKSSAILAIFCSFLLGFADSCFNTQLYSMLAGPFAKDSAAAFSIFKCIQAVASTASLFYASHVGLYYQLVILLVLGTLGLGAFVYVERAILKDDLTANPVEEKATQ